MADRCRALWVAALLAVLCSVFPAFSPKALADDPPAVSAEMAVVIDGRDGTILYDKQARARVSPASLTKMMTALIAIERGNLSARVRVDVDGARMAAEDGSSVMGLTPGEELSLEDLLLGLMLVSGNDAALAIARHIAGSERAFVNLMNARAIELGLRDTRFANPHGLDEPGHYSSAYDMAVLGRHAMRNPVFARIVRTPETTVQGQRVYRLVNTNRILSLYSGATGIKTGYTDNAIQALVASVRRDGRELYVTVIRSYDRYGDAVTLLDHYFEHMLGGPATELDWPVREGRFFTQANGRPLGESKLGFAVTDDADARFWSEFKRLGGVSALGYPISQRYREDGFVCQAFQRGVLQWRPEVGQAYLVNVFDQLSLAGKDDWLLVERSTPRPLGWLEDAGKPWEVVVANHLRLLDANPAIKERYMSVVGDPIQMNGLPMAPVADMGNVYVLRAQRAVFQQWKEDVPWARAGEVTVALGGDLAKEAGLLPAAALRPTLSTQ